MSLGDRLGRAHQEELGNGDVVGGECSLQRIVEVVLNERAILEVSLRGKHCCAVLQR